MMRSLEEAVRAFVARERSAGPGWRSRRLDTPNGPRVVAEFSLEGAAPDEALIVKGYVDDSGARTFGVMAALTEALHHRPAAVLATPEPLAYDAARRCLVQRRARGVPLLSALEQDDDLKILRRIGGALAELHALELSVGEARNLSEHIEDLVHPHPLALAERLPESRGRVEALVRALQSWARGMVAAVAARPLHRDFHPRQLFVDGPRVWVIDWDCYAKGDPALDVGNFLMCLQTRYPGRHERLHEAFVAGYLDRAPLAVEDRIPLYMALAYLRRAAKHFRLAEPGHACRTAAMLEQAERCLAPRSR